MLIRLGERTLADDKLAKQCERTFGRWGFHGFSVFEVPDGDHGLLARLARSWRSAPSCSRLAATPSPLLASRCSRPPTTPTGRSCSPRPRPRTSHESDRSSTAQGQSAVVRTTVTGSMDEVSAGADLASIPTMSAPTSWSSAGSHRGPRASDPGFDPRPGDVLTVSDEEGSPLRARVTPGTATGCGSRSSCQRAPTLSPEPRARPRSLREVFPDTGRHEPTGYGPRHAT